MDREVMFRGKLIRPSVVLGSYVRRHLIVIKFSADRYSVKSQLTGRPKMLSIPEFPEQTEVILFGNFQLTVRIDRNSSPLPKNGTIKE